MAKKTLKKPTQRRATPTTASNELINSICAQIALGESLTAISRIDKMPALSTIQRWIAEDNLGMRDKYARAKSLMAERYADEILEIADSVPPSLENGATDSGWVQHQRLQVESRKWLLSKLIPKKYGDRVSTEITGPDGGAVQIQRIERVIIDPK